MKKLFSVALATALTMIVGCGGKGMQPKNNSEKDFSSTVTEMEKINTDNNLDVVPVPNTMSKEDANKYKKILTRYIQLGEYAIKYDDSKKIKLKDRKAVSERVEIARDHLRLVNERLNQINKDEKSK